MERELAMNMIKSMGRGNSAFLRVAAPALVFSLLVHSANADSLYAKNTFFSGAESETISVDAPSAGTVSVTLTDLVWPDALSSLSFYGSNETSILSAASVTGGTQTFDLTGASAFYAHISASAGSLGIPGLPNYGWYSVNIGFTPLQAPVPLPASEWLLLAGLAAVGGLGALRWTRRPSSEAGLVAA
jgi:hypothetical protein